MNIRLDLKGERGLRGEILTLKGLGLLITDSEMFWVQSNNLQIVCGAFSSWLGIFVVPCCCLVQDPKTPVALNHFAEVSFFSLPYCSE